VFNATNMNSEYIPKFWHALLPSMWFAAPFGIFIDGNKQSFLTVLFILAIVGPILLMTLYIKKVVPYFEKNLQKLNENGGIVSKGSENRKEFIAALVCKEKIEKSMFKFTQNMIATERNLKLKVYPNLQWQYLCRFYLCLWIVAVIYLSVLKFKQALAGKFIC